MLTVEKVSCHVMKTLKQFMERTTTIRNWELLIAVWVNNLEVDPKASVKISNDCNLSWYLESLILTRWWARTTQLSHFQTPKQQKLWNNKCLLLYLLFVGCAGLHCCMQASSMCSKRGLLLLVVCGLLGLMGSIVRARGLQSMGSVVVAQGLRCLVARAIFPTRGWTQVPYISR